jgi:hypothetical protein
MTLGLIQQNERGAKFHPALQDLTHHLALWRCRWLSFALSSNCWRTLWAVGAHTMTRARDVHATWLAVAPLLLLRACCCCSSLTSALVSSRARVSRRVAARSKDRAPRPSAVAASDRRTERQPFNGALRSTAGSGCLTWSWSPARPGAGARGGAADERAAGARAAGGESASQPPPSTTPVLLSAGWSLAAAARDNYRDGVSRR